MIKLSDTPAFALEWCRRLSASPRTLEPLEGGINNQVFRCRAGRYWFVLKGYAPSHNAGHDRYKAEVEFLNYAQLVASEFVPQLLYSDETNRSVVLEYLEGERFQDGEHPRESDIEQMIAFMRRLNSDFILARDRVNTTAAEGFLRLTEHLQSIDQRIQKMSTEHLSVRMRGNVKQFIQSVRLKFECLNKSTEQLIMQGHCEDALDPRERCLSPSDLGFHNAIRTSQGIRFFDFEFAGWDDPAKAVSDFDLQPRNPVILRKQALSKAIPEWNEKLARRQEALFPLLKLKWACITLSFLNPERWAQRIMFNNNVNQNSLLQAKLNLAQSYLAKD